MPQPQSKRVEVTESDLDTLQASMRGQVIRPSHADYDARRAVINGMIDKRPAAIARCSGVADVRRALDFAVQRSLPLSIRGGGHGVAGFAVCDDGVVIDLSAMTSVYVDAARRTARAEGGTTWGQFDHETQAFGLATTGGLVRTTGIAGLTLAGGHGFLMRKYGLACDNLLSADVLLADGSLVKASRIDNADLFWALRGGGGNFGVVTSFEYLLHEVGPILGGLILFPFTAAKQVLKFYDEFSASAPEEVGVLAALGTLPDGTKAVVHPVCCCGAPGDGERLLKPLRRVTTPIADQIQAMPYTAVQSIVENFNPAGLRNYWKMVYVRALSDEVIDVICEGHARNTTPNSHIVVYTLGGAVARVPDTESAVSYRDARHAVIVIGMWEDAADDDQQIALVRATAEALQPYAYGGYYPNYETDSDRVAAAFGPDKYARLARIKARYDPSNVFCLNQNIKPAS